MKICSACLLGINCRYNGKGKQDKKVLELAKTDILIPVCPEQLGGLRTPREPAETTSDGADVIAGFGKVITESGADVTSNFIHGANELLKIIDLYGIKEAILKQKSPSCGNGKIYDGTFTGKLIDGDGVTAALLKKNGIKVISEEDL